MEKEIPQHQYMSGGEMDALMLAAMVECTLLEIIVLGGRDQNGVPGEWRSVWNPMKCRSNPMESEKENNGSRIPKVRKIDANAGESA